MGKKMSLIERLKQIPDPRSRRRREYPLYALLAVLILAAAHGENSLRGMWMWAQARAEQLQRAPVLGLWAIRRFPSLGTFWYLLTKLDAGVLEQALQGWGNLEASSLALDGKTLRGSKRGKARPPCKSWCWRGNKWGTTWLKGKSQRARSWKRPWRCWRGWI